MLNRRRLTQRICDDDSTRIRLDIRRSQWMNAVKVWSTYILYSVILMVIILVTYTYKLSIIFT